MYTPIIGLEIHLQIKTKSKVFCSCPTDEAEPNTNVCPICLGYPGTMPSLNKEALIKAIQMGIALNSVVANETRWDRKNYMYPDLFKGYQITQHDYPICLGGNVSFVVRSRKNYYDKNSYVKSVGIFKAHLEEDTAKSIHAENCTLIDGNKSGIPLLEIVTKPEMYSIDEAISFVKTIRNLARWFNVSDCNMEKGEMRFDANVSVCVDSIFLKNESYEEWKDKIRFTPIVEIKNLNSFASLEKALEFEIDRQIKEYESNSLLYDFGKKETRGWDEVKLITYTQRKKEEAEEYRYVPEPDIPIIKITSNDLRSIVKKSPEHPNHVRIQLIENGVNEYTVDLILSEKKIYDILKIVVDNNSNLLKKACNILTNELASEVNNSHEIEELDKWCLGLNKVLIALENNQLSYSQFKSLLQEHQIYKSDWEDILIKYLNNFNAYDIKAVLLEAFNQNLNVVNEIKKGKESAKMFFVGIVMKTTKGNANPKQIMKLIDELIKNF